ncbi:MAG: hypothetical protein F7C35_08085 [Desulfurococcales archaeon]|nr:hypothetical protein [Desulfurococcales archaeon]
MADPVIEEILQLVRKLDNRIAQVERGLEEARKQISTLQERLNQVYEKQLSTADLTRSISSAIRDLERELHKTGKTVREAVEEITATAKRQESWLEEFRGDIQDLSKRVERARAEIASGVSVLREEVVKTRDEVSEKVERQLGSLSTTMEESHKVIIDRIDSGLKAVDKIIDAVTASIILHIVNHTIPHLKDRAAVTVGVVEGRPAILVEDGEVLSITLLTKPGDAKAHGVADELAHLLAEYTGQKSQVDVASTGIESGTPIWLTELIYTVMENRE